MRGLLGVAVALMMGMPGIALAQSPDRPAVELGIQGSQRIRDRGVPVAWALRLTVPRVRSYGGQPSQSALLARQP